WQSLCQACRELLSKPEVDPESIAAAALTTQRSTLINLDENGQPLRPAIVWLDQRQSKDFK
ncbi:MAG: carbohydrate kinase, partial [Anaerolineae bacterium]|nr:carbohydrate kinase [Anaerolineae bacterium]